MLKKHLNKRLLSLVVATFCTLLLGLTSTLTFTLLGPALSSLDRTHELGAMSSAGIIDRKFFDLLQAWTATDLSTDQFSYIIPLVVVILAFLRAALSLLQWFLWERSSELIARDLRAEIISAYLVMSTELRRDKSAEIDQEISTAITNDIRMLREYLVHFFGGMPREVVQLLFYIIALVSLDLELTCIFIFGVIPAGILLSKYGKKLRKRSMAALDGNSQIVEWLQQRLSGAETIKHFRTEEIERVKIVEKSRVLIRLFSRALRVKARTSPMLEFIAVLSMCLILYISMQRIMSGVLEPSTLLSYFSVLAVLSQSASKIGRYYNSNKEGDAAQRRLLSLYQAMRNFDRSVQENCSLPCFNRENLLEIVNVSYKFPKGDHLALDNLTWSLRRGKLYVMAGRSGSGKSTLMRLMLGIWQPTSGEIRFGVKSASDIGYLPQTVRLFPGSLLENIAYPDEKADPSAVETALKQVGIWDFVESLPQKIHTRLGEGGTILSGGQCQRIGLARLIYKKFPLVMIDEGTSALDPELETIVLQSLRSLVEENATIILIAHRPKALQIADEVLILKNGKVAYSGEPSFVFQADWRTYFE